MAYSNKILAYALYNSIVILLVKVNGLDEKNGFI